MPFSRYAWGVLGYNLLVILWGAYVRATGSGAGCGSHWPLCNGVALPRSPQAETLIEFTHRLTSGLALLLVAGLAIWAFRRFPARHAVRRFALASVVLILVEALLGAGLVLFRYVADNASIGRAVYLSAHLVNTMLLLGALTLTAWRASNSGAVTIRWRGPLAGAFAASLILGVSGAVAALGDTLFPASSFVEGLRQETSPTAHLLIRLRLLHPLFAVITSTYLAILAVLAVRRFRVRTTAFALTTLIAVQLGAGLVNVLLLAPVWMQLIHLLLAELMWITLVVLAAEISASPEPAPAPDRYPAAADQTNLYSPGTGSGGTGTLAS